MERNNIYASTPPKVKSNTMISILHQRRPPVPVRADSTRSIGSTTTTTSPSNSFRHDSSSSSGSITQMKNAISKPAYNIEPSILNKNFIPLQSVKEDEFLEVKSSKVNINSREIFLRQCQVISLKLIYLN
jgi:hypothetical protein